jgi:sarcosine oxidase
MLSGVPAAHRPPEPAPHHCIVVGAGLLGLSTAWALGRRGIETLVLESAIPGHHRAGSTGSARIFRLGYPDPLYVEMARQAFTLWRTLEAESGLSLLETTGQLTFGPDMEAITAALTDADLPVSHLTPAAVAARFPGFRIDGPAVFEPTSGVLAADQCLSALRRSGSFELRSGASVQALEDEGDHVLVILDDGEHLAADIVVNCAGHHAIGLMEGRRCPSARPPTLQQVAYFGAVGSAGPDALSGWPVFIEWGQSMLYGLPVPGRPHYKVAQHVAATVLDDEGQPFVDDPELLSTLTDTVRRLLPGLDPHPVATERCIYDNTVDTDFILDRIGRIVVGCGTSGHGFKFGPLLGELLADLAAGTTPALDLSRFSFARSFLRALPDP